MQIRFYTNFEKKKNSTKRPEIGGGSTTTMVTVTGTLKEPCSIMNPVVAFQGQPLSPNYIFSTHYAYIPQFGKYYFVKDWTYIEGLWEAEMEEDVLATWKTHIGDATHYILRTNDKGTENGHWNPWVSDSMYPAHPGGTPQTTKFTSPFVNSVDSGTYIVGVIGSDNTDAVGAITYYAMTPSQFGDLKATLFGTDGLEAMGLMVNGQWTATDVGEQFFKTMYNPFQYIASCIWFPIAPSDILGTAVTTMKVGWWIYTVNAKRIFQKVGTFYDGVNEIPSHGQAGIRGWYLNYAPYSEHTLHGKFGSIPINTSFFELDEGQYSYKYIIVKYTVDYITGQCLVQIYSARETDVQSLTKHLIHKTQFLIGVPIQLAQIGMDYLGAASTALNSITGTIRDTMIGGGVGGTAGAIAGALSGASSGIYNTLQSAMPQLETTGSNGSFINLNLQTELVSVFHTILWEDLDHKGRPYCLQNKIKFMNGYVLCADGDVDFDCLDDERVKISNYLTTGLFWE